MTAADRDLLITRVFDAPCAKVWRGWTDPKILPLWWAPKPFTTPVCELDVRPGGASRIVMRDADGTDYPNAGVFLEVTPNERLVFTDAYVDAWTPSDKPFMTVIVTFEDLGGGRTRYTAAARHWSAADCETHRQMGFQEGWGLCADQLADVLKTL